jgi:hypothetical protein
MHYTLQALTERGTVGEVKRKQAAERYKLAYQKGKDAREVSIAVLRIVHQQTSHYIDHC